MKQVLRERFKSSLDKNVMKFISSTSEDSHLIPYDILANKAHIKMLAKCKLISQSQEKRILNGLDAILKNGLKLTHESEDVHMAVEDELEKKTQDSHSLRTARSRNDLVVTDLKLFVRDKTKEIHNLVLDLERKLLFKASDNLNVIMPGYTHLQRAQPVLFSHVLLAFFEQFYRDMQRLEDNLHRLDVSPMGACAMAGTSLGTDPQYTALKLGFGSAFENSLDAVQDRDFILDFLYAMSIISIHLSQIAETFIIWSTGEFAFIKLPDEITSGSSIMPQKKNPDLLELVRGKTGHIVGNLVDVMMNLKGLYIGYNRDLQETKPPMINAIDEVANSLKIVALTIDKMSPDSKKMFEAASDESIIATDVAEYLVTKGVPFKQAHDAVSKIVRIYPNFSGVTLNQLREIRPEFNKDIYKLISPTESVRRKRSQGSTGVLAVKKAIKNAFVRLTALSTARHGQTRLAPEERQSLVGTSRHVAKFSRKN